MNNTRPVNCAVCGAPASKSQGCACAVCGYPHSFVNLFSGKRAYSDWISSADREKSILQNNMRRFCTIERVFWINRLEVAILLPTDLKLRLVGTEGIKTEEGAIIDYSTSEDSSNNAAMILADGTVRSYGDNNYGQNNTDGLREIKKVITTFDCTYAITESGDVITKGNPVSAAVDTWKNVVDIAVGKYNIAALKSDGTVVITGNVVNSEVIKEISGWSDVVSIASSGNALIALRSNGEVLFAGERDDARAEARKWKNIAAVAIESVYAVGLTFDGKLLLAGSSTAPFLDMGRGDAKDWENVVAIATCRAGIGGLCADGTVKLAGNIRNKKQLEIKCNEFASVVRNDLVRCSTGNN